MSTFRTRFGSFTRDGGEYVIATPRTPRPWINVISNGDYGFTVSQAGGGYSWRTHAQLNRLTRWEQDLVRDEWGKFIYLRDERGNIWSAGWKPVCAEPERYRCRHGTGYTVIESRNFGIETELTMFVPEGAPLEVWRLRVRNASRRAKSVNLFSYLEWGLGQAPDWHREFHRSFIETAFDPLTGILYARKRLWEVPTERGHWNTEWPYVAFHASSLTPASFDTDRESFLGAYGTIARPAGVTMKRLKGRSGNWLDPCASLHHALKLRPGEEKEIVYTLGCADSREHAAELAGSFGSPEGADRALGAVKAKWGVLLGTVRVKTPDPSMDLMENTWLKYQAISGRMWGRTAYYQTGGAYGFRDQLQDSLLWLAIDPEQTKRQILLHARHQFADGSVYHWWHPLSEVGLRNRISDNLLWLPYVVHAYLQETADQAVLEMREPFVDDSSGASLYDHCMRAIDRARERFSPRGLPLIGEGDWNDGLSAVGLDLKGESIWLGHFIHRILLDFAPIAAARGDAERSARYAAAAAALRENLNTLGWDGRYYFGATKDSGEKIGSSSSPEGKLWLNPQTWAVIGGVADPHRAEAVLDVVEQELEFEIGPLLLHPAYTKPDNSIGYLTRYSPGMRENGGVYTHGATWAIVAAAILGRGTSAHRVYARLNPVNRGKDPVRYCAEPYVTAGNIEGPESPFFGRGGWTWYTGSAAWLFRAGLEYVLGVRPSHGGLIVDPCIPAGWETFSVRRSFRGALYHITVRNPSRVERGVLEFVVDGERRSPGEGERGALLPLFPTGGEHTVLVTMGRK
ncbi:MAG TPA: glycosyl transferase family 36 [Bacteroidota bacterium]|nr:glycosyl transferase family 36 [Bacteroidota bacterium]